MAFAFFDFDNTLIHGDAGPLFGRYLYSHRHARLAKLPPLRRWATRTGLWARYLPFLIWMAVQASFYKLGAVRRSSIVRTAYKGLRGVQVKEFRGLMDEFVDFAIPGRMYAEMVDEIRAHQAAGRRCVVVTTGMEELVERCLRHFPSGVELIGCRLEERKGRLTGRVTGPLFGVDKANILNAYCRAAGADLQDSYAYSDHWSDKHMLLAVGHAVAVNPRGPLRRLATRKGWRILEPRLDEPR